MTPGEIDGYVRSQLASGRDLYTLHAGLEPDLILTQDLCRVCALPSGQVSDALGYLVVRPGPRLVNGAEALASVFHPEAAPAAPPGAVRRVS
jgi:hypothetical protein